MKIFKCVLFLNLLVMGVGGAFADFGASGWTIFRKIQSSQFKAIATVAPVNGDICAVLYNPAILGANRRGEITFISEIGFVDDKFGSLFYTVPYKEGSMFSFGFAYYDVGIAELNWMENGDLKSRNVCAQRDMMGVFSYEKNISKRTFFGFSFKGASSELAETKDACAYALDLGLFFKPRNNLSLSMAIQNIGKSTAFISENSPLPLAGYLGIGYMSRNDNSYLLSALGVTYLKEEEKSIPEAGLEVGHDFFSLNMGYRFFVDEMNLHFGFKIAIKNVILGYAYIPPKDLSPSHRITLSYHFKNYTYRNSSEERFYKSIREKKKEWYLK